ncbi:MAG TPA: serine hydrolase, partial [Candidatus Limnocylindria bacterium]|nr:serine hydrolase [Candidatus Limnocylindria bacterium]
MDTFARVPSPGEMGLDGGAVARFFKRHKDLGIHTLGVVRGNMVYAVDVKPWDVGAPHTLFSLSKSYCSMAAGIAVAEGLLSYEDSAADVLSGSLPAGHDPRLHDVKLRHLLSMSSGLDEKSDTRDLRMKPDWAREVLRHRVLHEPGTRFHYNTHGTYLAGRMVEARAGMTLRDYLLPRLFAPLGIKRPQWDCCPRGHNTAGFGLHLSCMDIARTAALLLAGGVWEGKRLLPEDYLRQATAKQVDNRNPDKPGDGDWEQGYGWQFWMARHGRFRGDGMYGQVMLMDPEGGVALAVTAGLNDMGREMDALHGLLDDLLGKAPGAKPRAASLNRVAKSLTFPAPEDDGGELPETLRREGTWAGPGGRWMRADSPDEATLRLTWMGPGQKVPCTVTF